MARWHRTRPYHDRPPAEGANARNLAAAAKKGNMKTNAAPAAHIRARGPPNGVQAPPWVCSVSCTSLARCERGLTGLIGRALAPLHAPAVADRGEGAGHAIRTFREETSR